MKIERVLLTHIPSKLQDITCTHVVVPFETSVYEDYEKIFKLKLANRFVKSLLQVKTSCLKQHGIKQCIKAITEYGFDGCVFQYDCSDIDHILSVFIKTVKRLPPPYTASVIIIDFSGASDPQLLSCLRVLHKDDNMNFITYFITSQSCVKRFTDLGVPANQLVLRHVDQNLVEMIKTNKFGGIITTNNNDNNIYYEHLQHSLQHNTNNVIYPSSRFTKAVISEFQSNDIFEIISIYNEDFEQRATIDKTQENVLKYHVSVDIRFI